jgi:DNA-binding transcriptional LysR family regulator
MASVRLLLAFAEGARRGSFAAAARELGLSPSAIVKSVARLERELGVRLFQRTTRQVKLTQDGEALYERCKRVLDELADLELAAANASREPTGVLRLDMPITYGKQVLLPLLTDLAQRHPALGLEVRLSDVYSEIVGSGMDAVVRIGEVNDSRLVARVFDFQYLGVYGSPAYFARTSRPQSVAVLERHNCLRFRIPTTGRDRPWQFLVDKKPVSLDPHLRYVVNDGEALVAAAIAGLGLIQVPSYMAAAAVKAGELVEVLAKFRPNPMPISLVYASTRHMPLRLRLLIDALTQLKRGSPRAMRSVAAAE